MENTATLSDIEKAKILLNKLRIIKGQVAHIATCDQNGQPNLAPVGSMRITNDGKVHVIYGYLKKTYSNLKTNPKATFSFFQIPSFIGFFREKEEEILGYRIYCDFVEAINNEAGLEGETSQILKKFPWFLRKPFSKFAKKNFKKVLVFEIKNIRATK
ncbi:pyridoxamine 5'-phosphate oxidase family protein [bacterium]|nr:pyridoxamine 5'-phosphate oxidase family protein [bacterium]